MRRIFATALMILMPGCSLAEYTVDLPEESTLAAFPGKRKTQKQFASEKIGCEQKAQQSASKTRDAKAKKDVGSVGGGMLLGSILGTIFGASAGVPGGTARGAGAGASAGAVVGVAGRLPDESTLQGAFDAAFAKCMREAGNRVEPALAEMKSGDRHRSSAK